TNTVLHHLHEGRQPWLPPKPPRCPDATVPPEPPPDATVDVAPAVSPTTATVDRRMSPSKANSLSSKTHRRGVPRWAIQIVHLAGRKPTTSTADTRGKLAYSVAALITSIPLRHISPSIFACTAVIIIVAGKAWSGRSRSSIVHVHLCRRLRDAADASAHDVVDASAHDASAITAHQTSLSMLPAPPTCIACAACVALPPPLALSSFMSVVRWHVGVGVARSQQPTPTTDV
ncbi:hypothetical protein ACLOJK_015076, partial [Asimina triloba]